VGLPVMASPVAGKKLQYVLCDTVAIGLGHDECRITYYFSVTPCVRQNVRYVAYVT